MLRGEVIVWLYSLILYETVEMIATDLQSKDVPTLITGMFLVFFYQFAAIFLDF